MNSHHHIKLVSIKSVILLIFLLTLLISAFIPSINKILNSEALYEKDSILYRIHTTRLSINNLIDKFGHEYPDGDNFLSQLNDIESNYLKEKKSKNQSGIIEVYQDLQRYQKKAILSAPIIDFKELLLVKRKINMKNWDKIPQKLKIERFGFPSNHECNTSLPKAGYENEIALLTDPGDTPTLKTLLRSTTNGYIGEVDLHWDAEKILFTQSDSINWKVKELDLNTMDVRQITNTIDDVDCYDAAYLPNSKIVFGSTANYQSVPCWHGVRRISNLYLMNDDGSEMRRLCYDQDHDLHPTVIGNGQVLYNRWDYTGISHIYLRQLMVMNPDGTAQRAVYGSNSYYPNSFYFARELPGKPGNLISIISGYHGVPRMGQLVVIDTRKGWHEEKGIVALISGKGESIKPKYVDELVLNDWPKFATPYPLSDQYFLVSCWKENSNSVGIYLADVFDNLILIKEIPGYALLEPVPLKRRKKPPVIPDRTQPDETEATVYIHNIYKGEGLKDVPEGTIKEIRVIAYNYGFFGMAGPDKIGYGGPWEAMQIVGTAKVEEDGSSMFKIPANTPVAFHPLDGEGSAVQLMRSWTTAMPGEYMSCVGCHESPNEIAPATRAIAALNPPQELERWYGKQRGFDFEREVQPVLNKYCIDCHNGEKTNIPDLRSEDHFSNYIGKELSDLGLQRLHPNMMEKTNGFVKYTPAYDALIPYIRRVSVEDDVSLLLPGEYHTGTSPLIQLLKKEHHGVMLNREAWDRLFTWIDLNGPCHGTWNDVFPVQDGLTEIRRNLTIEYGGPVIDPEYKPELIQFYDPGYERRSENKPLPLNISNWPLSKDQAKQMQSKLGNIHRMIRLDDNIAINMIKIPAGTFLMGDVNGYRNEWPQQVININNPFWISTHEITNEQFRAFFPDHDSRYYQKRRARHDGRGLTLNENKQPVIRVSWKDAVAFCNQLSEKSGLKISLPTEAQWEYACRAGSASPLYYGEEEDDFSSWANLGDQSFGPYLFKSGGVTHRVMDGAYLADTLHNDHYVVTAPVGSYLPNNWGLYDMHGNAAEWVKGKIENNYVMARGGSFYDHPKRARSAYRTTYPDWQKVYNVGFRIVAEIEE